MIVPITKEIASMELCCAVDETRHELRWVHANKAQARFEATNGHILSIIECPQLAELPESLLIRFHGAASKLRYGGELDTKTGKLAILGKNGTPDTKKPPLMMQIKPATGENLYPEVEKVLPTRPIVYRAALNVDYLMKLSKSVEHNPKTHMVVLEFNDSGIAGIRVRSAGDETRHGLIMPLRCETHQTGPVKEKPAKKETESAYSDCLVSYTDGRWKATSCERVGFGETWKEAIEDLENTSCAESMVDDLL